MQEFNIGELVEIRSHGIRLGHHGKIVNKIKYEQSNRIIYEVKFEDGCIGFFDKYEVRKQEQK